MSTPTLTLTPTLTPHQALQMLRVGGDTCVDGISYLLDGPMGCPSSAMFPVAYVADSNIESDESYVQWYPTGEVGSEITEATTWTKVVDGEIVTE